MAYFPNDDLYGVAVDLDSGTVFDIRSIVYVPMTEWEKVSKEFEYGQISDYDVINFASSVGQPLWVYG